MKSPIPWIGGKSQLKSKIISLSRLLKATTDLSMYSAEAGLYFLQKANTLI